MAEIGTTTTLAALMQESMGRALAAPRIEPLFWPGNGAASALMFWDATGGGESSHDFNRYGTLTAYDTVEGEEMTQDQSLDPTSVNVSPTEKQVITWITNKALKNLGAPNARGARMADEAAEHVRAHQQKYDEAVFALFPSLTAGATGGSASDPMAVADITSAKLILRQKKAPGPYWGFLSEQQWNDLVSESGSGLTNAATSGTMIGEQYWRTYEVKQFLGVTWFITDNVYDDGTYAYGAILSNRAIGAVMETLPTVQTVADTSAEAVRRRSTMFSTVASYNVGIVDATMGVYLKFDKD